MAEARRFVCPACDKCIEAWSDGNPYYLDDRGRKQYAYHPDYEKLAKCIGNDVPHLCLNCANERKIDSEAKEQKCPACHSEDVVPTYELEGRLCPVCNEGHFEIDPDFFCVS